MIVSKDRIFSRLKILTDLVETHFEDISFRQFKELDRLVEEGFKAVERREK